MPKAPKSYVDKRRPPLFKALRAEGCASMEEALASLVRKGYFTAKPRPWKIGFRDRGLGHGDYGILDRFGGLIADLGSSQADAELIVAAVNAYKP